MNAEQCLQAMAADAHLSTLRDEWGRDSGVPILNTDGQPTGYVLFSESAALSDTRLAGCGMMASADELAYRRVAERDRTRYVRRCMGGPMRTLLLAAQPVARSSGGGWGWLQAVQPESIARRLGLESVYDAPLAGEYLACGRKDR